MTKVLHISNWYPNLWNSIEAQFVKELYDAVPRDTEKALWHVQVRHEGALFQLYSGSYSESEHYLILDTRIQSWRVVELLTLGLLVLLRLRLGIRDWNLVNAHIAYPLLRFPRLFRQLFGRAVVISEHWSAYKSSFGLKDGSRSKRRMQNIFQYGVPVVAVSEALSRDIYVFSGRSKYPRYVVPNIVDSKIFYPSSKMQPIRGPELLMVADWSPIKKPLLVLKILKKLMREYPSLKLKIIGYGSQWNAMERFVSSNNMSEIVSFLGRKTKMEIATEMRKASAFVHASEYETFSVVCAEALCSGLPVIASNVGGIVELVDHSNGVLVENDEEEWFKALSEFLAPDKNWDAKTISESARARFSPEVVGRHTAEVYQGCILSSRST